MSSDDLPTLDYANSPTRQRRMKPAHAAGVAYTLAICAALLFGIVLFAESRFEQSIPPGGDSDDVGGQPFSSFVEALGIPLLVWLGLIAAASAIGMERSRRTIGSLIANLLVIGLIALVIVLTA